MIAQILDLFFPRLCLGCSGEGSWFCDQCLQRIELDKFSCCPECLAPTVGYRYCSLHTLAQELKGVIVCADFGSLLREVIHLLKYDGIAEVATPLGSLLQRQVSTYLDPAQLIIIPVPLHRRRQRERGFNQSELLARALGGQLVTDLVRRVRSTRPQAELNREQRVVNLIDSFQLNKNQQSWVADQTVLLVDDVLTTGSTLKQVAQVVAQARPVAIWAAVLARS